MICRTILTDAEKANETEAGINAAGKMNMIGGGYAVLKRATADIVKKTFR